MKQADRIAGFVVLGIAVLFMTGASRLPMVRDNLPGPGFLPFGESLLLAVAALWLIVSSPGKPAVEKVRWPTGDGKRIVLHLVGVLFGYVLIAPVVGYFTSTFLFMFAAGRAWRCYSWRFLGISAAIFSLLLYVLIDVLLGVALPRSSFGLP